jgi:hypothetical protein
MKSGILQSVASMLFVIAVTPSVCRAQAEISPDHFDSPSGGATVAKSATSNQKPQTYDSFFLPFEVNCAGTMLKPGRYSLSIQQSGKRDVVRFTRIINGVRGQAIAVTATPRLGAEGPSGLVIARVNQRRTLTAIGLRQLGVRLVLQPNKERVVSMNAEPILVSYSASRPLPVNGQ